MTMMNPARLTPQEKEELSYWLALQARAGGWFFVGMLLLMLVMAGFNIMRHSPPMGRPTTEELIPLLLLLGVLVGTAVWLFGERQRIRRQLDEPLWVGNGRIRRIARLRYSGYQAQLDIQQEGGVQLMGRLNYFGNPGWREGDMVPLIFWDDGRFCPRHIHYRVSIAHLPTPARKRRIRNRVLLIVAVYFLVVILSILLGLYGQGRL